MGDMFGGGMSGGGGAAGSTVVEKNLDRLTVITAVMFSFFTLLLTFLLA
jgi:preprotein translocase subunit SecG